MGITSGNNGNYFFQKKILILLSIQSLKVSQKHKEYFRCEMSIKTIQIYITFTTNKITLSILTFFKIVS